MASKSQEPSQQPRIYRSQPTPAPSAAQALRKQLRPLIAFFERLMAEKTWRARVLRKINSQANDQRAAHYARLDRSRPPTEFRSAYFFTFVNSVFRKRAINAQYPLFGEKLLVEFPLLFLANGAALGGFIGIGKGMKGAMLGAVMGFSLTSLAFYFCVESAYVHVYALSEGKYAGYIRQEYLKRFPGTGKAILYSDYNSELEEKYKLNGKYRGVDSLYY